MIGATLAHYRITARIGQGGMGEVYRARDDRLGLCAPTRYDGVPRNGPSISAFHQALGRVWRVTLMRRSQNGFVSWARMRRLMARWVPRPRICHPYPNQRLAFVTQGRSRMR